VLEPAVDIAAESAIRADPQAPALAGSHGPRQVAPQTLGFAGRCECLEFRAER
jgi:hypothetical protein